MTACLRIINHPMTLSNSMFLMVISYIILYFYDIVTLVVEVVV